MIPAVERIVMAPVACPDGAKSVRDWLEPICEFAFREVADLAANRWMRHAIEADGVLAPGQTFAELDYAEIDQLDFAFRGCYVVERDGVFDAIGAWFECDLAPGVEFSTAPGLPPTVYEQAIFPLNRGHEVKLGDVILADISARYADDEHFFDWNVAIEPIDGERVEERHSEYLGIILNPEYVHRMAESFAPAANRDGEIERALLEMMNGRDSLRVLAERLAERFPDRFGSAADAMPRVRAVSRRFGE